MLKEQILEIAKGKYPIGTDFRVAHKPETICRVVSHDFSEYQTFIKNGPLDLHVNLKSNLGYASVYYNGKWAEIISKPEVEQKIMKSKILEQEISIVENKEGGIFKIGDKVQHIDKTRKHYVETSKILKFIEKGNNILAVTDYKTDLVAPINIDKLELIINKKFPEKWKIRSLGNPIENAEFVNFLNGKCINNVFSGSSSINSFYIFNMSDKRGDCSSIINNILDYETITIEQFREFLQNEE
jgi:hypothetical protein